MDTQQLELISNDFINAKGLVSERLGKASPLHPILFDGNELTVCEIHNEVIKMSEKGLRFVRQVTGLSL